MTVRRLIRSKQLAAVRVRGRLLVRASALEVYVERQTLHAVGELTSS
jgi:excisionase family DNA binding protein